VISAYRDDARAIVTEQYAAELERMALDQTRRRERARAAQ